MTPPTSLPFAPDLISLSGKRVTVMGLGLFGGGAGVTRWLAAQGARVTVTDLRPEQELAESVALLSGLDVALHLGGHRDEDFTGTDCVVVSPAIPLGSPWLRKAVEAGVRLETEINLAFKLCRGMILGITGSNGKTTTTALAGDFLKALGQTTWVGGNIGGSPLDWIGQVRRPDRVVLELSSFQLDNLGPIRRSPHIGIVTNLTPNHLDRHGSMEAYAAAKRQIIAHQGPKDHAVLNGDDPALGAAFLGFPGKMWEFGSARRPENGAWYGEERVEIVENGETVARVDARRRQIPGAFNLANIATSALAAWILRKGPAAEWERTIAQAIADFPGVEHRLERVAMKRGVRYVNDSIATNPESVLAALDTLEGPIVLIAGGYDKKLPFDGLAKRVAERVKHLVLLGDTAPAIARLVEAEGKGTPILRVNSIDEAVTMASVQADPGDTVLLSPACASFGLFRNFAERGKKFKEAVGRLVG